MQLITLATLIAAAATSVLATPLSARQGDGVPRIRATFYDDGGCHGNWGEDFVFLQDPVGVCRDLDIRPFQSTYFNESSLTKTMRFYNLPCAQVDAPDSHYNYIDILKNDPTIPGCKSQVIRSYRTLEG